MNKREKSLAEERRRISLYRRVAQWELRYGSPRIAAQLDVLAEHVQRQLPFVGFAWYDPRGWYFDSSAKTLRQVLDWPALNDAMQRGGIRERAHAARNAVSKLTP